MHNLIGKLPLRMVLIVSFVTIIVVASGLTGYLSFRNGQNAVNDLASQLLGKTTVCVQHHLDRYLATPHLINQINLDSISLGQLNVQDFSGLESHFWKQIQQFDSVEAIRYADEQAEYIGVEYIGVDRNNSEGPFGVGVSGPATDYALEVYALNERGNRTERTAAYPDYDPRSRPWYQTAVQNGRVTWTPIFVRINGDMGTDVAIPVYNQDGDLMGVLDVFVSLSDVSDFLRGLDVGKTGQTFIIERSGLLVASSTAEEPYTQTDDETKRSSALDSSEPLIHFTTQHLRQHFGELAHINASQQLYFDLAGERQLVQVTPFQDEYGLDWLIGVVVPESDFMAQINANNRNTILLIKASLISAIIVVVLAARSITQPISHLNHLTRALAQGDWSQKITLKRSDELGELANSFNRMAEMF